MSTVTNTKALNVRVLGPNNNTKKIKNKKGNIDIHLSMTQDSDGHHTLTVGSKIDGQWVPLNLKKTNRWWDRLSYVPKRYQQNKSLKNKIKLKAETPRQESEDDKSDIEWWDRLSRLPMRWVSQKEAVDKTASTHSQRPICCGGEAQEAWWNRLSKHPWVQAQEQRQNFQALQTSHQHEKVSETFVPEFPLPESPMPQSPVPDIVVAESSIPESFVPESSIPESFVPESSIPESFVPESFVPESFVPESFVPESSIPESFVPESFVPESFVPESSVPEYDDISIRSSTSKVRFNLNENEENILKSEDNDVTNKSLTDFNYEILTSEYNDYSPREMTSISSQSEENLSSDFQATKDLLETVLDLSAVSSDSEVDELEQSEASEASKSPGKKSEDSLPHKPGDSDDTAARSEQ